MDPWSILECRGCGLRSTWPVLDDRDWDTLYDENYQPHLPKEQPKPTVGVGLGWCRHAWASRIGRLQQQAGKLRPPRPRIGRDPFLFSPIGKRRLLDVGCGAGIYLARMRQLGWSVLGIDRSPRAADVAHASYQVPVVLARIPSASLEEEEFDLVTAWQVLEHLTEPEAALAWLRDRLSPTGWLILTVPNSDSWASRHFRENWIAWDLPRHQFHFTRVTLARMVENAGLEPVVITTTRQSGWIRRTARMHPPRGLMDRLVRTSIGSRFASTLAHRFGRGESLYLIARRQAA